MSLRNANGSQPKNAGGHRFALKHLFHTFQELQTEKATADLTGLFFTIMIITCLIYSALIFMVFVGVAITFVILDFFLKKIETYKGIQGQNA